mmetsp:Transcript_49406/g.148865  ORF Transcript_49406/g.148865 Transcript_49406/m.148865 type:complete len:249 (+) Transcript_49406:1098-1844(+)
MREEGVIERPRGDDSRSAPPEQTRDALDGTRMRPDRRRLGQPLLRRSRVCADRTVGSAGAQPSSPALSLSLSPGGSEVRQGRDPIGERLPLPSPLGGAGRGEVSHLHGPLEAQTLPPRGRLDARPEEPPPDEKVERDGGELLAVLVLLVVVLIVAASLSLVTGNLPIQKVVDDRRKSPPPDRRGDGDGIGGDLEVGPVRRRDGRVQNEGDADLLPIGGRFVVPGGIDVHGIVGGHRGCASTARRSPQF